jgi:hypothetical protein
VLQFAGEGASDGYGLGINNVRIIGRNGKDIEVVNGNFQEPNVGTSWIIKEIPGWHGVIEIGSSAL